MVALVRREDLGIDRAPYAIDEAIELGAGGRHDEQMLDRGGGGQGRNHLLFELRPIAAGDDGNRNACEHLAEQACHLTPDLLLALGERPVEVESD